MESVPPFIAGNRYQMDLAHAVRRLPRGYLLFAPIDEDELLDKMRTKESAKS
jgi:hypothetical protein